MKELSLHILDIVENSIAAKAKNISIIIHDDIQNDHLSIIIKDDGKGMDANTLAKVTDPFYTSRTTRKVGLGIPLFKAAAEACNGSFHIQSKPAVGTEVTATFQRSHIDRMPLGDLAATSLNLVVAYPDISWYFHYQRNNKQFIFDSKIIRQELEDIPYSDPLVLSFLRKHFTEGLEELEN